MYSDDDDEPCDRNCFGPWLAQVPLEFQPGEKFQYSNPGYSAIARIIEKASGQDYETFIRESLVQPLHAGPIGYLQLAEDSAYAIGYLEQRRIGAPPELGWMKDGPPWHLRGNGGLLTITNNAFDRQQIQSLLNDLRAALGLAEQSKPD